MRCFTNSHPHFILSESREWLSVHRRWLDWKRRRLDRVSFLDAAAFWTLGRTQNENSPGIGWHMRSPTAVDQLCSCPKHISESFVFPRRRSPPSHLTLRDRSEPHVKVGDDKGSLAAKGMPDLSFGLRATFSAPGGRWRDALARPRRFDRHRETAARGDRALRKRRRPRRRRECPAERDRTLISEIGERIRNAAGPTQLIRDSHLSLSLSYS